MKTSIASLSIAARATLDMHSLNNEGGEGNQIQTRMVDIVDHLGELHNVNAISGDMAADPASTRCSAWRVTCRCFAAAVTDIPSAGSTSCRKISPG